MLFADMADYTPTAEKLGEEAVYGLMRDVIARMSEAVHAHEGTVQNLTGDGVMALFGAPQAIEDAPLKACRAALDLQSRMADLEGKIEAEHGIRPRFRVGLHTGPLVVGTVGDDKQAEITALGDTVNLASRLQEEAELGGIAISEATHQLVDGYIVSAFAGERDIKGKSEPQRVYSLDGLNEAVSRFDVSVSRGLTELVGRQGELETLKRCWDEAQAGALRVVNIIGEAGIGKSPLVHDFRETLDEEKVFYLQGRCTPSGTATPFLPFTDVVRSSFRIGDDTGRAEIERRLMRGLETLGIETAETLPYLLNLLGHASEGGAVNELDSEAVGVRTRAALLALLRERRRVSPVVMFIDDLHWMDGASQELMASICAADHTLPMLLICAFRPQYAAPWVTIDDATDLRLGHLSEDGTATLLKSRLGAEDLPDDLIRLVADKAEGNPLFAEEITNYLIEKGAVEILDGAVNYQAEDGRALPVTLENLLMDRFDRLDSGPRTVLEAASVIGPQFASELIAAASGLDDATLGHLVDLERQEILLRDADGPGWRFKHALVREAIYDSLLAPKRESLHLDVAKAIEGDTSMDAGEHADILAHHYSRTRDDAKAVHYLALAGERGLIVYSLDEAEIRFRDAIARIDATPGCVEDAVLVDILLRLCRVLYFSADFYGIIALIDKYLEIVERLGDQHRLARFLFETGYAQVFSGQHQTGRAMMERALAIAEETGDREIVGYVSIGLMWHHAAWAPPTAENRQKVLDYSAAGFKIAEELNDVWLASKCLVGLPVYYSLTGRVGESRRSAMRLLEYGRTTNDPRPRTMAMWALAALNASYFNFEEAIANAEETMATGLARVDRMVALAGKGTALAMMGRGAEAREALRESHDGLDKGGLALALLLTEFPYGLSMVLTGEMARGCRWIEDTATRFAGWGFEPGPAYGDLYLGLIHLDFAIGEEKPPPEVMLKNIGFLLRTLPFAAGKARRHLERAAGYFRDHDMPGVLAWSLTDLARLHAKKKRTNEARACLEEAMPAAHAAEEPALVERIDAVMAALPAA